MFCCKDMRQFLDDPRDPIFYDPVVREYYVHQKNATTRITFSFCPWCGHKLPSRLRAELMDILIEEYKLDVPIFEVKSSPEVPGEFKTDEWWKKRGL
jgi:hypothetical protein